MWSIPLLTCSVSTRITQISHTPGTNIHQQEDPPQLIVPEPTVPVSHPLHLCIEIKPFKLNCGVRLFSVSSSLQTYKSFLVLASKMWEFDNYFAIYDSYGSI